MPKSIKFKHFVETLLQIIEDKSRINFSYPFFLTMITVLYCQLCGYIFSTYETKPLVHPSIRYFAHIMEYSPGTFLLLVTGNDSLTLFFFIIFEIFLYGQIIYICILTYIRLKQKDLLNKMKKFFQSINFVLQIFFTCFLWIFYVPFTEIHAGMAVCGENSFLVAYRGPDGCNTKPLYQIILGVMGVILTFLTGCLLNYFYVNYDFLEKNLLKRRFSFNLMFQLLCRSLLIFLYYLKLGNINLVKHIVSHILGITMIIDILMNMPFKDKLIMLYYGTVMVFYESTMIIFSLWNLTDYFAEFNLFYFWLSLIPLTFGLMYTYWVFCYNSLIILNFNELGFFPTLIDQYLEEISLLAVKSEFDKESKLKLMGILQTHINYCQNINCNVRKNAEISVFIDKYSQINQKIIIKIINNWFTVYLSNPLVKKNQSYREFLSLKYCSFLANFQDNPIRAYYELKTLLNSDKKTEDKSENSLFFRLLSKIISKNIEKMIFQQTELEVEQSKDDLTNKNEFQYSISLQKLEKFNQKFKYKIIETVEHKQKFWQNLSNGYNNLDDYKDFSIKVSNLISHLREDFAKDSKEIEKSKEKDNILYLKMYSIFQTMVLNDFLISYKIESKILDIKKRETGVSKDNITSLSIVKGNSITLIVSLLNETGKILSKKTDKIANFFNYDFSSLEKIDNISSFLPLIFSEKHQKFIKRYIECGQSRYVLNSRLTFCKNFENYIFPIKIFYNFLFDYAANFSICATMTKIETSSFFLICSNDGIIRNLSSGLKEILKIQDKYSNLEENMNILLILPNLFDNVNFPEKENYSERNKDFKYQLLTNEKVWIYPPKCETKQFLENFRLFKQNLKEEISNDLKNIENRNFIKNFLINQDTKQNLRKVLCVMNLSYFFSYIDKTESLNYYIIELIDIYLDKFMDPEQSTGARLTENLTENTKNLLKTNQDEDNSSLNKEEYIQMDSIKKELIPIQEDHEDLETPVVPKRIINPERIIENVDDDEMKKILFEKHPKKDVAEETIIYSQTNTERISVLKTDSIKKSNIAEINQNKKNDNNNNMDHLEEENNNDKKSSNENANDKITKSLKFNSKDDDFFRASVSSASSLQTNYGSLFLKELVNGSFHPKIIKKIFFTLFFQILFFFAINLVYIFLINSRMNDFKIEISKITNSDKIMDSYSKILYATNAEYLLLKGVITKIDDEILIMLKEFRLEAYNIIKSDQENILNEDKYRNEYHNISIYLFINSSKELRIVNYVQLCQLINKNAFILTEKGFSLEEYLFFRMNYYYFILVNEKLFLGFSESGENNRESLYNFYIILSIIGITVAIILQLINIPFFNEFYILMEKILLVLSRVNEYECHREISLFEKYLNKLKSKKDEYLIYEFLDFSEENTKTQILSNKTTGKSNNVSSIYLSSRISTQKLKKLKIYMINISTILIVSVFFIVVLVFSSFLNTNLNGALILQEKTSKFTESSNIVGSLQNIIFSYNNVDENLIENEENLNNLIKIYYENVDEFIAANQKFLFQFSLNDLIPESNIIELNSVIKNNICLNRDLNKYCNLLEDNNFLYGLNGYIQNYIKLIKENLIFIENYKENQWDKIYDKQNLRESLINSVIFYNNKDYLEELVQKSIESIINKIYNNLLLLFLLGGSGCSLILCLIYSFVYMKIKQDFKSLRIILLLIPFKKLKEDSTLYLLRNLKKF